MDGECTTADEFAAFRYDEDSENPPRLKELRRRKKRGLHRFGHNTRKKLIAFLSEGNHAEGIALFKYTLQRDETETLKTMDDFICGTALKLCEMSPSDHAETALEILNAREALKAAMNESTFSQVINILARANRIEHALEVLAETALHGTCSQAQDVYDTTLPLLHGDN